MLIDTLKTLYSRDLNMLKLEISQYRNEEKIWYIEQSIANWAKPVISGTGQMSFH
jgi:hypothetical protein